MRSSGPSCETPGFTKRLCCVILWPLAQVLIIKTNAFGSTSTIASITHEACLKGRHRPNKVATSYTSSMPQDDVDNYLGMQISQTREYLCRGDLHDCDLNVGRNLPTSRWLRRSQPELPHTNTARYTGLNCDQLYYRAAGIQHMAPNPTCLVPPPSRGHAPSSCEFPEVVGYPAQPAKHAASSYLGPLYS